MRGVGTNAMGHQSATRVLRLPQASPLLVTLVVLGADPHTPLGSERDRHRRRHVEVRFPDCTPERVTTGFSGAPEPSPGQAPAKTG